ncbi:MAG: RNA-binding protein [Patescibacteria group bacterium]
MNYIMDKNKVFVGSLPWSINNDSLKELFAQYGEVTEAVVIMDRETQKSKGFGFVTFATEESAQKALEMSGKEVDGRAIVVNIAKPREERRSF